MAHKFRFKTEIGLKNLVLKGDHPWIVAIAYKKRVGCGGTIMTANYVITAAHCVGGEPRDSIVLAGVHNLDHLARQRPEKVDRHFLERIQGR